MITEFALFERSENFLFEDIKNKQLMIYYFKYIYSRIGRWLSKKGIDFKVSYEGDGDKVLYRNIVVYTDDKLPKLDLLLKQLKRNLLNHNIIFSYQLLSSTGTISIKTYLKDLKLKRMIPDEYVYHTSKEINKESILKYGLIPKESKIWDVELEYPPAVFAINKGKNLWFTSNNTDLWKIDTKGLPNIWWKDLNGIDGAIMTFDPIPVDHLELLSMSSKDFQDLRDKKEREEINKIFVDYGIRTRT